MTKQTIKAVLFDLDDTLYDRRQASQSRVEWFVETHLPQLSAAEKREAMELIVFLDANGYGRKDGIFRGLEQAYPRLGPMSERLQDTFIEGLIGYLEMTSETRQTLDALNQNAIPFGIVTNAGRPDMQMRKIEKLGLDNRTDCVFISSSFGSKKPAPEIFRAAASALGALPEHILFVGDHPVNDIVGASRAGMKTAWLRQGREWPSELTAKPDSIIGALPEILPLLGL